MSIQLTTIDSSDLETITGGLSSALTDAMRNSNAVGPAPKLGSGDWLGQRPGGDIFNQAPKEDPTKLIYAPVPPRQPIR